MLDSRILKLIFASVLLLVVFMTASLWRVDQALFVDRQLWLESQLQTRVSALEQSFLSETRYWLSAAPKDFRNWPQWIAGGEVGAWEESFSWKEKAWPAGESSSQLLQKLKKQQPQFPTPGSLIFDTIVDSEQKSRGLVWIRSTQNESKFYFVVVSIEPWQAWIDSLQSGAGDLFVMTTSGVAMAHQKHEYVGQKMTDHPIHQALNMNPDMQQFKSTATFPDQSVQSVVAEKVPHTNLTLVATFPQALAMSGRGLLRSQLIFLGLGFILILTGLIVWWGRTQQPQKVTNPSLIAQSPQGSASTSAVAAAAEEPLKYYKTMASALGHEMRSPLTSILTAAQSISQEKVDTDAQRSLVRILKDVRELRGLVDKILGFSGIAVGSKIEMKLETPLRKALKKMEAQFQTKHVQLLTEIEDQSLLKIDQEALQRAFENILQNSIESMERQLEKKITVSLKAESTAVVLSIVDNGQGMSAETLQKAKDPFYSSRSFSGHLGLGLSEAEGLLKEHSAEMRIASEVGKGTKVDIYFPLENADIAESITITQHKLPRPAVNTDRTSHSVAIETPHPAASAVSSSIEVLQPPQEPDDINELLELPPALGVEEISGSSVSVEEISLRLRDLSPLPETAKIIETPQFQIEKSESRLDQHKVSIRKPQARGSFEHS